MVVNLKWVGSPYCATSTFDRNPENKCRWRCWQGPDGNWWLNVSDVTIAKGRTFGDCKEIANIIVVSARHYIDGREAWM